MKKLIIYLWLCCLFLSGCTSKKVVDLANDNDLYFLYVTPLANHPIWLQSKEGFLKACAELNIHCDWIGPNVIDTQKMDEVFRQGIYEKADGIITQGVISKETMKLASDHGILVTLVDSNIEDVQKFMYYGKNFHTQAELFLKEIEKNVGKDTPLKIAIQAAELDFKIAQDQIKEIENVFSKHHKDFEIVSVSDSKSDKVRAQSEWFEVLVKHPEINVCINFAAESAEACGEVAISLNRKDEIFVYGVDNMETTIEYIRNGIIDASVVTSFYQYGYQSVYRMYNYLKNKQLPNKNEQIQLIVVNKENVDTYEDELK